MQTVAAIQTDVNSELIIVDDLEVPDPGPGQVVVELFSSGICHSQLHHMRNPQLRRPMVLGHEGAGVAARIGPGVAHIKEGDYVLVTTVPRTPIRGIAPYVPTGATWRGDLVHGVVYTWGKHSLTWAERVIPIPREIQGKSVEITCVIGCAVLTGMGAVLHTAKVRPGDSVAVFGAGGVGLSAILMASILNAQPIIAVDIRQDKLELAKEFGATHSVDSSVIEPVSGVLDIVPGGVDYAFDAIGIRETMEQILPVTKSGGLGADNLGGTAVLIGQPETDLTVDARLLFHQRRYMGSVAAVYPDRDIPMYLRWWHEGKLPLDKLVTRRYPLSQLNAACAALAAGEILGRAIIEL